ncbi:glycosyl transferase family 2 [Nostoc minutum NIES-26]|uniref:Glycosyl transferase family 2 n=1 Tax=Nostoc minutum NIES-26 TaxID=1844469 RepID=A0A367QV82_9NOSO|nr:glycosyl transferase family 2 [Nostoc minutum NIES-26]
MSNTLKFETQSGDDPILLAQAQNDALIKMVSEQITLDTFDPNDQQLLKRMVVEGLGDSRGLVRLRFAETLGEIGEPATPFLLEALANHPNPVVRRAAAKTLNLIADPTAVPGLLHALLNDEDTVVKGSAAGALARTGEAAVPALLDILASPENPEDTKGQAAWALAFMGSEAAEHLYKAVNSNSVDVRCAAVGAIAHVAQEQSDERACKVLVSSLTDPASVVRTEAAAALAQLNYPPAVPHLILALRDTNAEVRTAAVTSLGKIGDRSALEPLQTTLNDELESIQRLAKLAISQIEKQ